MPFSLHSLHRPPHPPRTPDPLHPAYNETKQSKVRNIFAATKTKTPFPPRLDKDLFNNQRNTNRKHRFLCPSESGRGERAGNGEGGKRSKERTGRGTQGDGLTTYLKSDRTRILEEIDWKRCFYGRRGGTFALRTREERGSGDTWTRENNERGCRATVSNRLRARKRTE